MPKRFLHSRSESSNSIHFRGARAASASGVVLDRVLALHPAVHLTIPALVRSILVDAPGFDGVADLEIAIRELAAAGSLRCKRGVLWTGVSGGKPSFQIASNHATNLCRASAGLSMKGTSFLELSRLAGLGGEIFCQLGELGDRQAQAVGDSAQHNPSGVVLAFAALDLRQIPPGDVRPCRQRFDAEVLRLAGSTNCSSKMTKARRRHGRGACRCRADLTMNYSSGSPGEYRRRR